MELLQRGLDLHDCNCWKSNQWRERRRVSKVTEKKQGLPRFFCCLFSGGASLLGSPHTAWPMCWCMGLILDGLGSPWAGWISRQIFFFFCFSVRKKEPKYSIRYTGSTLQLTVIAYAKKNTARHFFVTAKKRQNKKSWWVQCLPTWQT